MSKIEARTVKLLLVGIAIGAVGTMFVGFKYGDWYTAGGAKLMAETTSNEAVAAALTPQCVARAQGDPENLTAFKKQSSYGRTSFVQKAEWPQYPSGAGYKLKRAIDEKCVEALVAES